MPQFRLWRFARKELREILRDRRTVLTLVLMPLLLYPLLSVAFRQFFLTSLVATAKPDIRIGVAGEDEALALMNLLRMGPQDEAEAKLAVFESPDPAADLAAQKIDVAARVRHADRVLERFKRLGEGDPTALDSTFSVELTVVDGSAVGRDALQDLRLRLADANTMILEFRLARAEQRSITLPVNLTVETLPDSGRKGPTALATLIPLVLILMTITGAVYPAIDLTAGERERGTLEILMAAPVPRVGLLMAKYLAVLTVAMLTALANLGMMALTVTASGLGPMLFGERGLSGEFLAAMLGLLLLFVLFFSAVLLAVTSFARSFKEAQAYLIPIMILALAPGVMALMPGLQLGGLLAVTPLLNVVLLARNLFEGGVDLSVAAVVVLSTLLYAAAAIGLAARVFGAEAVLYSEQATLAETFRRPTKPSPSATPFGALLVLAVLFPLHFMVSGFLAASGDIAPESRFVVLTFANVVLFAGMPLTVAAWGRVEPRTGFALGSARWKAFAGALMLGVSLWPFVGELLLYMQEWGLTTLSSELRQRIAPLLEAWKQMPLALVMLSLALVPAAVEELFFRGYLFGAMSRSLRPRDAIIVTAVLFGLFHVLVTDLLVPERLLPSTLLGLVLGWVRWRSGSVWPGMVLHACNNGAVLLAAREAGLGDGAHVPAVWLLAGLAGAAAGVGLVWAGRGGVHPTLETLPERGRGD
jgi:ABC-2 type transport system permease protein/sodium transport system permease protein